jgi:hypothetical protein
MKPGERLSVYAFATLLLCGIVALAFAVGWLVGKMLL